MKQLITKELSNALPTLAVILDIPSNIPYELAKKPTYKNDNLKILFRMLEMFLFEKSHINGKLDENLKKQLTDIFDKTYERFDPISDYHFSLVKYTLILRNSVVSCRKEYIRQLFILADEKLMLISKIFSDEFFDEIGNDNSDKIVDEILSEYCDKKACCS